MSRQRVLQLTAMVIVLIAGLLWSRRLGWQVLRQAQRQIHDQSADQVALVREKIADQTNPFALVDYGRKLLASNRPDFAIPALEKATELQPAYRDAWYLLGYAYVQNGQVSLAKTALAKANSIDPAHAPTNDLLKHLGK